MQYERECVYNVRWQMLRAKMLGTWTTPENVRINIYYCQAYYEVGSDKYERAFRCANYMAAISLGYGNKPEFAEQKRLVTEAHRVFAAEIHKYRAFHDPSTQWNWDLVEQDLKFVGTLEELQALKANLDRRLYTSKKRTGGTQHRPELVKFYSLLTLEISSRTSRPKLAKEQS